MSMKFKFKDSRLGDAAAFGRVVSVGLVVAGYVFLGAWLAGWLNENEYPAWLSFAAVAVVAAFGLWQGWLLLTRPFTGRKKTGD